MILSIKLMGKAQTEIYMSVLFDCCCAVEYHTDKESKGAMIRN